MEHSHVTTQEKEVLDYSIHILYDSIFSEKVISLSNISQYYRSQKSLRIKELALIDMSLQKCVQVEHMCLFHLLGNKLDSALPPTSQACFCISSVYFGYFLFLESLCSRHLRDKFSHFFQVFAQIYCFSEVYPDNPNLKLGLTQSNSLPWPLLFQIFFILIYFSVLITHRIWIYSKIYMFITYLLFIVFEWNISSRIIGIFVLFIAKSQAPTMVLGGWVLCEYVA